MRVQALRKFGAYFKLGLPYRPETGTKLERLLALNAARMGAGTEARSILRGDIPESDSDDDELDEEVIECYGEAPPSPKRPRRRAKRKREPEQEWESEKDSLGDSDEEFELRKKRKR